MSDSAFIGEIRAFPYKFAPEGWLECDGRTFPLQQFQALYLVIGFQFGGDGKANFAIPDMRGYAVRGTNPGVLGTISPVAPGKTAGTANVQLSVPQFPSHSHTVVTKFTPYAEAKSSFSAAPSGTAYPSYFSNETTSPAVGYAAYNPAPSTTASPPPVTPAEMSGAALSPAGGGQAHENRQPFQAFRFCICATNGMYPVRP